MQIDAPQAQPAMLDTAISQGKPRKNLVMAGVVIALAIAVAWMLWPQQAAQPKKIAVDAPQGGDSQQTQQVAASNFMKQLEQQVGTAAASAPKKQADSNMTIPSPPIQTIPYQQASGAVAQGAMSAEEKAQQKRETIWASSPSVSGVKLLHDHDAQPGASNAVLDPLAAAREALAMAMPKSTPTLQQPQALGPSHASPNDLFLSQAKDSGNDAPVYEQGAYRRPVLMQGTIIRAVTISGINTDLPGDITARVVSNVYDSVHPNNVLIPQGSTLIGRYDSNFKIGQARVLVAMTRLILPNGKWISLAGSPATDTQGMSGMPADVNNHFLKMFGSSLIIGATSLLLPSSQQNITVTSPTISGTQTGGTIFAQTLQQSIQQLLQRNTNIKPTGTVGPGTEFDFMVSRDMLMSPYPN
jgi:type IV secretion system protein VirB10